MENGSQPNHQGERQDLEIKRARISDPERKKLQKQTEILLQQKSMEIDSVTNSYANKAKASRRRQFDKFAVDTIMHKNSKVLQPKAINSMVSDSCHIPITSTNYANNHGWLNKICPNKTEKLTFSHNRAFKTTYERS